MAQLILLVVAAAWLAVLIPPMLRSRVENRPNSSVTDFRRQLTRLENTATPARGSVRAIGRPLAQSPLSRPVASGRQPQPVLRSGVTRRPTKSELDRQRSEPTNVSAPSRYAEPARVASRYRSHGDPTGGQRRPSFDEGDRRPHTDQRRSEPRARTEQRPVGRTVVRRDETGHRAHGDPSGGHRRPADGTAEIKRRRTNILFMLVVTSASSLFLAATTSSDAMLYVFVASFLALSAYIFMLAQQQNGPQGVLGGPAAFDDSWSEGR